MPLFNYLYVYNNKNSVKKLYLRFNREKITDLWYTPEKEVKMPYKFYGADKAACIKAKNELYKNIRTPLDLYDALKTIWCEYTCAPRLRSRWSRENITCGQCAITSFLAQDIFGGDVYGIQTKQGGIHCYNVVDGTAFDLTCEQFGGEAKNLVYSGNEIQERNSANHFLKEEKRLRYEYLIRMLSAKKALIVVDMQKDFINGSLGTKEAEAIVPAAAEKIRCSIKAGSDIIFTRDTHESGYLSTNEGKHLPVVHCVENTPGWQIAEELSPYAQNAVKIFNKHAFGSIELAQYIAAEKYERAELCGLCTDICVVSNALLVKAECPEIEVAVDSTCCAGVTKETHNAALSTMKMCQIEVI